MARLSIATLLFALLALVAGAAFAHRELQSATSDCIGLAMQIGQGDCSAFINDVKGTVNGFAASDDGTYRNALSPYLARYGDGTTVSAACCNQAAAFVAGGCSCNRLILSAAGRLGFGSDTVANIPRLYQFSCRNGAQDFANGCSFSG